MEKKDLSWRIMNGDRQAFDDLCRGEIPVMISYARSFLSEEWAEDVVQDVLYSLWNNRKTLNSNVPLRSYLLRSVYNRSLNYLRRENLSRKFREWNDSRINLLGLEAADPDKNPVIRKLFDGDLRKKITDAIDSLPTRCREVFILSYIEDVSNKEISARLGISLSTVENHMYSALKSLRSALSKDLVWAFFAVIPYLGEMFRS